MAVRVEPAKPEHIVLVLADVREADVIELMDGWGKTPEQAMKTGLMVSALAWMAWIDEKPFCMFGVGSISLLSGYGIPWLVGTNQIDKHAKSFVRPCREYVLKMADLFPRMENHVDARNTKVIKWLKMIGFRMNDPEPFGPKNLPFIRFELKDYHV